MRSYIAMLVLLSGCDLYFTSGGDDGSSGSGSGAWEPRPDAAEWPAYPDASGWPDAPESSPDAAVGQVRDVVITWDFMGFPASGYTCASADVASIRFVLDSAAMTTIGPVACTAGTYTIANVPSSIEYVYTQNPAHDGTDCTAVRHWINPYGEVNFDLGDVDDACGM